MGTKRSALYVLGNAHEFDSLWTRLAEKQAIAIARPESLEAGVEVGAALVVVASSGQEEEALDLLDQAKRAGVSAPIAVGPSPDHRLAVALMRRGAAAYFALPQDAHRLEAFLNDELARDRRQHERQALHDFRSKTFGIDAILGEDEGFKAALDRARRILPRGKATILITGETGTGKDVLARAIHYNGPRRETRFVPLNCSAIPNNLLESELFGHERGAFTGAGSSKPGLLEAADGGTLFLDEVATLELDLQAKLLRALETQAFRRVGGLRSIDVDFRVIAATNEDLAERVRDGRFRKDLYYRLAVIPIHLPPLRDRGGDVLLIARRFLSDLSASYGVDEPELSREAEFALLRHPWPGNVRELRNVIERGLLLSDGNAIRPEALGLSDRPDEPRGKPAEASPLPFPSSLRQIEEAAAHAMVGLCNGNKSDAARRLGITRSRLYGLLHGAPERRSKPEVLT